MSDSPGTYRADDYGGGTHPIQKTGGPKSDNYLRNPMTKLGNAAKSREQRLKT